MVLSGWSVTPRYLAVLIGTVGWSMVCNHLGIYGVTVASAVAFFLVIQIEEAELRSRFGAAYEEYQKDVPQLLPSSASLKRFLRETL